MNKEQLLKLTKSELIDLLLKIKQEAEGEIWEYHKFDDNFGMTFEQTKKVNEFMKCAHNTPLEEIIKTIKNYVDEKI